MSGNGAESALCCWGLRRGIERKKTLPIQRQGFLGTVARLARAWVANGDAIRDEESALIAAGDADGAAALGAGVDCAFNLNRATNCIGVEVEGAQDVVALNAVFDALGYLVDAGIGVSCQWSDGNGRKC
jgi:hypothetical protein